MHNEPEDKLSNGQTIQNEDPTETVVNTQRSSFEVAETRDCTADGARCFVPFCGLVFYTMAFLSLFCSFALRVTLSVTIVAMVNQTAVAVQDDVVNSTNATTSNISGTEQCPRDVALQRQDGGEFNWNRNQQGAALAAFYYGYIISQVCIISTSTTISVKQHSDVRVSVCPVHRLTAMQRHSILVAHCSRQRNALRRDETMPMGTDCCCSQRTFRPFCTLNICNIGLPT